MSHMYLLCEEHFYEVQIY